MLKARVHELANKLKLKDVELAIKEEDLSIQLKDPRATEEELQSLANEIALKTQEFDATLEESTQVGIMLEAAKLELRQLVAGVKHSEALKNGEEGND